MVHLDLSIELLMVDHLLVVALAEIAVVTVNWYISVVLSQGPFSGKRF